MYSKILLFIILTCNSLAFANFYSSINYVVNYHKEKDLIKIIVETEIIGIFENEVLIDLPRNYGLENDFIKIKNLQLINKNLDFFVNKDNKFVIKIPHQTKSIKYSYLIDQKDCNEQNVYSINIDNNTIYNSV